MVLECASPGESGQVGVEILDFTLLFLFIAFHPYPSCYTMNIFQTYNKTENSEHLYSHHLDSNL